MSQRSTPSCPSPPPMEQQEVAPPSDTTSDILSPLKQDDYTTSTPIITISQSQAQSQQPQMTIDFTITGSIGPHQPRDDVVPYISLDNLTISGQETSEQPQHGPVVASSRSNVVRYPSRPLYEIKQDFIVHITVPKYKPILRELILGASLTLVSKSHYETDFDPTITEIRERLFPLPSATEKDMVDAAVHAVLVAWAVAFRDTIRELLVRAGHDLVAEARKRGELIKKGILDTVRLVIHTFDIRDPEPQAQPTSTSPPPPLERPQSPKVPRVPRTPMSLRSLNGPGNYRCAPTSYNTPNRGTPTVIPTTPTRSDRQRGRPASERPERLGRHIVCPRNDTSMPPPQFKMKREIP
ncbi:hypothetical protein RRF57_011125 [Xylaria bambusicola]|uniref:Uncharacterized protein n=1 Tax=Xylaria bambusicola TaxID=326684 RepID=A0AAN7UUB6_9PEZI